MASYDVASNFRPAPASGDGLAASAIAGVQKNFQVVVLASDGVTPVSASAAAIAANDGGDYVALIVEPAAGRGR